MECAGFNKWNVCWNRRDKLSRLYLNGSHTGNITPFMFVFLDNSKKENSYSIHINTPLLKNIKYNTQC